MTPVLAVYCSGSRQAWSLSLIAALMALSMLLLSPRRSVPLGIWVPLALAMILGLCFAMEIKELPAWRSTLLEEFQIDTGTRLSPQPWISFERWLMGALCLLWLWFVISLDVRDHERRFVLQLLTGGLTLVIVLSVWWKVSHQAFPAHWHFDNGKPFIYGPLPNRNHFSGICAITGILSFVCIYDSIRRQTWEWIGFAICLPVAFAALMINTSRFGVLMFFLGCGAWMLSAALRDRSARKLANFASLFLIGTTFLLVFGQRILKRFVQEGDVFSSLVSDGRTAIHKRTLEVLTETPWTGWGIGTFNQLFAILDPNPSPTTRISHPESDILWLAFEMGIPATLLFVTGAIMLIRSFGPWRSKSRSSRNDRRLRNGAAIAAMALLAQGLVDVPLHMIGVAVLGGLLAGLGSRGRRSSEPEEPTMLSSLGRWNPRHWWHYPAAAVCLGCAILWFSVHRGTPIHPTDTYARQLLQEADSLTEKGQAAEALKLVEKAAAIRPLHWESYLQQASLKLTLGYPHQQVLADFAKVRALEKKYFRVAYLEAQLWEPYNSQFAIAAYAECIRREPTQAQTFFQRVNEITMGNDQLRYAAKAIARTNPKLHLTYLMYSDAEEFQNELEVLLAEQPQLDAFNKNEKLTLFKAWYDRADRNKLLAQIREKPAWMKDGWVILANHHAQNGDFQSACKLGFEKTPPPIATPPPTNYDVEQLTRLYLMSPTDIARGLQLYEALKSREDNDEALRILNELSQLPSIPNKVLYEKAYILNRKKEYAKSWEALQQYLGTLGS